jgi:uracil-DNA glycosylase family 4
LSSIPETYGSTHHDCTECPLHEDAQTVCLWGSGNTSADVMIVGEAPGLNEDRTGLPFQGKAGKLLDSILYEIGVNREEVYITNAVKCRPPGNRAPEKEEIKTCFKYLAKEVEEVQPKLILTLGNTALQAVTGHSGIGTYRGKEVDSKFGVIAVPTYHPAAVLRSPKYMTPLKADMQKAFKLLDETNAQKFTPVIHLVTTKESLRELLKHLEEASKIEFNIACADLETTTFDFWRPQTKVMSIGICADDVHCWAIPLEHPQSVWRGQSHKIMEYLRPYLERKFKWTNNNWKYDKKWLRKKYNIEINYGPDPMLIGYAVDENCPHDLKYQAAVNCDAPHYSKDIVWPKEYDPVVDDIEKKVAEYGRMPLQKLLKYNALDAFYGRHVYFKERAKLVTDIRSARIYKHLLENGSHIFTDIEYTGMWVDKERLDSAFEICQNIIDETLEQLNALIPEGWCERHLSKKQLKTGFNWNSTKQLGQLFFGEDGFDFPVIARTGKGAPSTSESVLIELGSEIDHPAINLLGDYRKWAKYMSTYLKPWRAKLDEDSRLHPKFKLHGTVTGRLSGEDGVHQVPRDKFIRSLIGAPPGWTFLEIDGSQIELRVVAAIAGERTMIRIFATDGDIHRETAATVTGKDPKDVTSDERKKAKAVNFGFVYGMGWKKFKIYAWEKYGVRLTDAEAKMYRKRFFEKYGDLLEWHARMRRIVRATGYVVSPIGRKRRLPNIYSIDEDMQSAAEREAINSPVQGLGSDIVLGAFIDLILNILPKHDPNWKEYLRPVGAVHDAQYWEIRNDKLLEVAPILKDAMSDMSRLKRWFGYELPVPMKGDIKIGNHWGDAKDWEPGQPLPFEQR